METLVKQAQLQANLLSLVQLLVSDDELHDDELVIVEFAKTTFTDDRSEEYNDNYKVYLYKDGDVTVNFIRYSVENDNLVELIDDYDFDTVSIKEAIEFIKA